MPWYSISAGVSIALPACLLHVATSAACCVNGSSEGSGLLQRCEGLVLCWKALFYALPLCVAGSIFAALKLRLRAVCGHLALRGCGCKSWW